MARVPEKKKSKKQKAGKVPQSPRGIVRKEPSKTLGKASAARTKSSLSKSRKAIAKKALKSHAPAGQNRPADNKRTETDSAAMVPRSSGVFPNPAPARLLNPTKTTSAALALLSRGVELIHKKEYKKAKEEFLSLLQSYPNELEILARARTYIQICEREQKNLKKAPPASDQLYALGTVEHNKANYDAAISYFTQALEKNPNADFIYYSMAAAYAKKGDIEAALQNLRKAVELNEDSRIFAKNDADFETLHGISEFAELVGLILPPATESK